MDSHSAKFLAVDSFLAQVIERGDSPGAVYLIGERGKVVATKAIGHAVVEPELIEARLDTIYDLASLTKPLVTALLAVKLAEGGLIGFDERAADYLPELARNEKQEILIKHLLTHTAGLPAWKPLYNSISDPQDVLDFLVEIELEYRPGKRTIYSDLGYILLGKLIERVCGEKLDQLARKHIFEPLKLKRTFFNPPDNLRQEIAATEMGNLYEARMIGNVESGPPLRRGLIWGQAHDGNAYFLGGVSGHAGLFSTAQEVFQMAMQFLPGSCLLGSNSFELFRTSYTAGLEEDRSIAFMLASSKSSSAGQRLPWSSFGHTGFTGTSLWIDPGSEQVYILLTNRVHPICREINFNDIRRRFHDLAAEAMMSDG